MAAYIKNMGEASVFCLFAYLPAAEASLPWYWSPVLWNSEAYCNQLRHHVSWTEQILYSWNFYWETALAKLAGPQSKATLMN